MAMLDWLLVIGSGRSSKWPALRRRWLMAHPECAACGKVRSCVPHHILPVHVCPERELDETNLLTLCDRCHLPFGHLGDFRSWNATVVEDAALWLRKFAARP